MILLAAVGAMILFGIIAIISILVGLNASSLNPQEIAVPRSYSDDWYGPDYNYAFQPEGVENATKYFVTAFDEDFNNTSRSYYQAAGIDGWSVLYSDDSDAPYRYNISGSFKYDRWVEYEGNECYHIVDTWICAVLEEISYSDDWYGPDYNYAFQPEGVENATIYLMEAVYEEFNTTSRTYYKQKGVDGWIVVFSDDLEAPYKYSIVLEGKYDHWVQYNGNECYHIEDTWHCAVLDLNSTTTNGTETDEAKTPYSDDWYGPYYNYAFQPEGVEKATKVVVTAVDEDFENTSRTYYQVEGITGWTVLYSDVSNAGFKYDNIAASFIYDRWVKYESNECYHSDDNWACFVEVSKANNTGNNATDEAKIPYSADWYGPDYSYAFQPEGIEEAKSIRIKALTEDFQNSSRYYYQIEGQGWIVLYSDDSDAPYLYDVSESYKYDRWVSQYGMYYFHYLGKWSCFYWG